MKKRTKRIVYVLVSVLILFCAVSVFGGFFLLNYALSPSSEEKDFRGHALSGSWSYMYEEYPFLKSWVDSLKVRGSLRDTFILSEDGVRLHALYAFSPEKTRRTAVIVHGYTDNAVRMLMIGYMYHHDLRYNILLPDLRYAGESGGDHIQMGWLDRLDVLRWMEVANTLFGGSTEMVVHGISMGAATVMMVSGEPQPDYVRCYVEDCGYSSVYAQFRKELQEQFGLPSFPFLDVASCLCKIRYDWSFQEASAVSQVRQCFLPMFFIHGSSDDYVPVRMVYEVYEAKPSPKELWVVSGVSHAFSYRDYREEYTRRVRAFTERYLSE